MFWKKALASLRNFTFVVSRKFYLFVNHFKREICCLSKLNSYISYEFSPSLEITHSRKLASLLRVSFISQLVSSSIFIYCACSPRLVHEGANLIIQDNFVSWFILGTNIQWCLIGSIYIYYDFSANRGSKFDCLKKSPIMGKLNSSIGGQGDSIRQSHAFTLNLTTIMGRYFHKSSVLYREIPKICPFCPLQMRLWKPCARCYWHWINDFNRSAVVGVPYTVALIVILSTVNSVGGAPLIA